MDQIAVAPADSYQEVLENAVGGAIVGIAERNSKLFFNCKNIFLN